jgi:thioredoxin reductase
VTDRSFDAVIVGGGPAGLSAALWLARYRRSVLVLDDGEPRNEQAWGVHGYPGLADPPPHELRHRIREQAMNAGAEHAAGSVAGVRGGRDGFTVTLEGGKAFAARRVLLAYGLRDVLPDIDGLEPLYGRSVFHCADCDGPTVFDRDVGVIGWDEPSAALALYLLHFGRRVHLLLHGRELDDAPRLTARLADNGVAVHAARITGLRHADGVLEGVRLADADELDCTALFYHLGTEPSSGLAARLGCERDDAGFTCVDRGQATSVRGVYAAGDITGRPHLAVMAAASGVRAALAIHRSLLPDAWEL